MSYLKDREIWLSNVPTGNPPAGYFWKFIQNGKVVVRDSSGNNQIMVATSGSQAITGSLTVTGGITGTVSSASYVEYSNVANKPALVSGSSQITYSGLTGIPSGIVSGSAQIASFGIFATTGSNGFNGSQSITGSLTVTGQVVAQTLNVQQVTSSIVYSSGSNVFGNSLSNTQQFTGSVGVTGSLTVAGAGTFSNTVTSTIFDSTSNAFRLNGNNALSLVTLSGQNVVKINAAGYWGSQIVGANDQGILVNNSGNVSIGNNSPEARLHVTGTVEANGSLYRAVFGSTVQDADMTGLTGGNGSEVQIQAPSISRGAYLTLGGGMNFGENLGGIAFYNSNNVDGKRLRAFMASAQEGATAGEQGAYLSFGTAANAGSVPSERMRITSGGNVGIGITGPSERLEVNGSLRLIDGNADGPQLKLASSGFSDWNIDNFSGNLRAYYGSTEYLRITSGGVLKASNAGNYASSTADYHELRQGLTNTNIALFTHIGASPYGPEIGFSSSPNNSTNYFLICKGAGANMFIVYSNGNVVNQNGSYGAISDVKLKENIEDASPKLDDLMKVKVRNYNLIGDDKKQIGVIAQELQEVFPAMIDESPDKDKDGNGLGTTTKSVKYSVFVPMLIKALQEQQTLIESLKSRIEILEQ